MRWSCLIAALLLMQPVKAQEVVDSDQLVRALTPSEETDQPRTRGLSFGRGISVRVKTKVDLRIPFEFNSSQLAPEATAQLTQLSDALARDSLATFRFEIAGHTDASGAAEYNRRLSEARAESVRAFLIQRGIDASRLQSVGYGEEQLADPANPNHADNRRVEIRNLGSSEEGVQ